MVKTDNLLKYLLRPASEKCLPCVLGKPSFTSFTASSINPEICKRVSKNILIVR